MMEYRLEWIHRIPDAAGNFVPAPDVAEQLNQWAREGWELAAVEEGTFYLCRQITPSEDQED